MVRTNPHHKWGTKVSVAKFPSHIVTQQLQSEILQAQWACGIFTQCFSSKFSDKPGLCTFVIGSSQVDYPTIPGRFFKDHTREVLYQNIESWAKKNNPNTSDYKRICVVFDHHVSWLNHLNPTSLMVKSVKSQRFMVRFPGGWRPCQGAQKRHCSGWRWPLSPLPSQRSSWVHVLYRYAVTKIYIMIHVRIYTYNIYIYTHYIYIE